MTRRVLVLAFKFPDLIVPGGSVRIEKFLTYLPKRWESHVLSVKMPPESLTEPVHRSATVTRMPSHFALFRKAYRAVHIDSGHRGRAALINIVRRMKNYVLFPDDAVLLWPLGLANALRLIRRHRPDVIFATAPPFSVALLAALAARISRVPFVADFRDDWAGNPPGGRENVVQRLTSYPLEALLVRRAARLIHVTEGSMDRYARRYPDRADRMALIRNGFDEAEFKDIAPPQKPPGRLHILHTGSMKEGRSPVPVLRAMDLLAKQDERFSSIRLAQIGTTHREHRAAAFECGLDGRVSWVDPVPRREVIARMGESDVLLLIPTSFCPTALPGKLYEYLRTRRPMLVITGENESARFLAGVSGVAMHRPDDVAGIAATLQLWFDAKDPPGPDPAFASRYARHVQAEELARLLDEVVA